MYKEEKYLRIPKEKQNFYKNINVNKDTRYLIKILNALQKEIK